VWEGLAAVGGVEISGEAGGEEWVIAYLRVHAGEEVCCEVERGSGRECIVWAKAILFGTLSVEAAKAVEV